MDEAAVGFQLGFAGAFEPDAAFLALQVAVAAHEPCAKVGELGEFYLQAAFLRLRAQGKDGEYEADAVEHAALQGFFQIAFLGGGEFVVEHGEVDVVSAHESGEFFGFARADKQGGMGSAAFGGFGKDEFAAGGTHEFGSFGAGSLKGAFPGFV